MTHPGYVLDKDESGLTVRERQVLAGMKEGKQFVVIAAGAGVSKQRVLQLVRALEAKGFVIRTPDGEYAVIVKKRGRGRVARTASGDVPAEVE